MNIGPGSRSNNVDTCWGCSIDKNAYSDHIHPYNLMYRFETLYRPQANKWNQQKKREYEALANKYLTIRFAHDLGIYWMSVCACILLYYKHWFWHGAHTHARGGRGYGRRRSAISARRRIFTEVNTQKGKQKCENKRNIPEICIVNLPMYIYPRVQMYLHVSGRIILLRRHWANEREDGRDGRAYICFHWKSIFVMK